MKRLLVICSILVITIAFFLTCGTDSNIIKIQFWAFGGSPTMMKWTKERVASFNQKHPVVQVIQGQKSWNMIRELLYTNFSTGTGPDVMRIHANYAAEFGESGHLYPVNNFPDFDSVRTWYQPNLFEACRYKDNYYGLPGTGMAFVLVCNQELFNKEGLTPPKTWSEFRATAKKLTKDLDGDGAIDQWGMTLLGGDRGGFSYRLAPFILKAGGTFLSDDLTKVTFNNEISAGALQLLTDMYQKDKSITPGFLAYSHTEINDLFCGKKVAMAIEGPWMNFVIQEKNPGMGFMSVPVPVPDDKIDQYDTAPTLQDMVMIAISAHSKHLNEAWQLTKYLRNEEADMEWIRQDMGAFPTTLKAINSPEKKPFPHFDVFVHELQYAKPWPAHPKMITIVRNVIAPYGQKAIIGELTVEKALELAAKEAQDIIEGNK